MVLLFLIINFSLQASPKELRGIATSVDGKMHVYTEVHNITVDEKGLSKKIETKYLKPDGKLFAEMTSDFSKNATIPEVKFLDKRFDKAEELIFKDKEAFVVFKSSTGTQTPKVKEVKIEKNMAAGQGFDNFVKINFDSIKEGSVPLVFGVLSEMDFFSFKGYKKSELEGNRVQFGIDLSSFLFRLFSSELILEYDNKTKQILSYKGLSNLLTDEGKGQNVLIKYEVATP